jgi:group II intron reverse transcriptase/maturase
VLRAKAKGSPSYRFYALYDKVYREDVLTWAYARCRHNGGAPGVDGQTFEDIETYGIERWLAELAQELKEKTYRPEAVKRVWIPKGDGKQRPLGVPTIRDRVAQMAAVLVLEPIFDEDLPPEQHAYRANHSAHDALRDVQSWLDRGYTEVVDADLSGYFDSIPHHELMQCVARRISDRHLLHLIKMWLEAPVEETDKRGRTERTTRNKDDGRGTPQGGVAAVGELVHATICARLEGQGARARASGSDRELCGRLRDLLPTGQGRRGHAGDAADDGEAAAHGQ